MKRLWIITAVIVSLSCVASQAMAGAGTRNVGENWWLNQVGNLYEVGTIDWITYTGGLQAGADFFHVEEFAPIVTKGDPNVLVKDWGNLWAYCIDDAFLQTPDWYEKFTGGTPAPNIPDLTPENWAKKVWLVQNWGPQSLQDSKHSAGMQIAVWEVITDGLTANPFTTGLFKASFGADVMANANFYLNATATSGIDWSNFDVSADTYFVATDDNGMNGQNMNTVVPEIPTALLAPIGLAFIGWVRRKIT